MSDQRFYVGAQDINDRNRFNGYVPAKFLMPGGSQNAFLYSDTSGNN